MNYKEALEYWEETKAYGIVPGLESVRELCRRLGNPQDKLCFVHIAGTNGKGSVLSYLSNIVRCAGYRVGSYHSPAISNHREEIQVGKCPITKAAFAQGMERIKECCEEMTAEGLPHPTTFEIETALAFWHFQEKKCDVVILETGMGGLMDATNIIATTKVAVLTSIGRDHMQFLGDTIEEIAEQKAGIIKEGCAVVSMKQSLSVMQVIEKAAAKKGCGCVFSDSSKATHIHYGVEKQYFDYEEWKKIEIRLAGKFQIDNAVLALEVIKELNQRGFFVSEAALRRGFAETVWQGRFSVIGKKPLFIADGAHNEDAAQKLAQTIELYFTNKRIIYIMGMLKDKETDKVIALTEKYADQIITITPPDNPRAMHSLELAQAISAIHPKVTAVDSLEEAVEMSRLLAGKEDVIIAFGSLSYLGRLMSIVAGHV